MTRSTIYRTWLTFEIVIVAVPRTGGFFSLFMCREELGEHSSVYVGESSGERAVVFSLAENRDWIRVPLLAHASMNVNNARYYLFLETVYAGTCAGDD